MQYDIQKMLKIAAEARGKAYATYSQFAVGACIFTEDGQYYGGCNVENTCYPCGQCAEATAIGNMIMNGSKKILATLVLTDTKEGVFPCGLCLQKLSEFMAKDGEVIAANLQEKMHSKKLSELFSAQFADMFSELKNISHD